MSSFLGVKMAYPVCQYINWTSDHTPVSFSVSQKPADQRIQYINPIRIMTWNKLNQCHSKLRCKTLPAYSNNPWDIDEVRLQYQNRMAIQRDFLIKSIEDSRKNKKLHVICLQEANDLIFCQDNGFQQFYDKLSALNWSAALSTKENNTKLLVVLFDHNRLKYVGQRGVLLSDKGKNSGLEVLFDDLIAGQSFAVTNIHLEWNEDYRRKISAYQTGQIARRIFTVICGDTNHPPNFGQLSFVGNSRFPTNIDVNHLGDITANDGRNNDLRHYDSLAASPAEGNSVRIEEEIGKYFALTASGFEVKDFNPLTDYGDTPYIHESEVNRPWIRREYLATSFADLANCRKLASAIKDRIIGNQTQGVIHGLIYISEQNDSLFFDLPNPVDHEPFKALLVKMRIPYGETQSMNKMAQQTKMFTISLLDAIPLMSEAEMV